MKNIFRKSLNVLGCLALLLGSLSVNSASMIFAQQTKCPDELLK